MAIERVWGLLLGRDGMLGKYREGKGREMGTPAYGNARMILFAIGLPDWNSLESVRDAHSNLEAGALVFFALLVVSEALAHVSTDKKRENILERIGIWFFAIAVLAEIAAYPYRQRNDTLSGQTIVFLSGKAGKALTACGKSREARKTAPQGLKPR